MESRLRSTAISVGRVIEFSVEELKTLIKKATR